MLSRKSRRKSKRSLGMIPSLLRRSSVESTKSTMVAPAARGSVVIIPPLLPPPITPPTLTDPLPSRMEILICQIIPYLEKEIKIK
jgi:hypothetical protein